MNNKIGTEMNLGLQIKTDFLIDTEEQKLVNQLFIDLKLFIHILDRTLSHKPRVNVVLVRTSCDKDDIKHS